MGWALHTSADGEADFQRLSFRLQEDVLDELERLLAQPDLIPPPLGELGSVHTFSRKSGDDLVVLVLTLNRNELSNVLTLLGIRLVRLE